MKPIRFSLPRLASHRLQPASIRSKRYSSVKRSQSEKQFKANNQSAIKPQYDFVQDYPTQEITRLFTILEERPSSRYDCVDYEMDRLMLEIDKIINECKQYSMYNALRPIKRTALPLIPAGNLLQKSYNITKTDLKIAKFMNGKEKNKWRYTELIHISPDVKQRVKQDSMTPSPKRRRNQSPYEIVANFQRSHVTRSRQLDYYNRVGMPFEDLSYRKLQQFRFQMWNQISCNPGYKLFLKAKQDQNYKRQIENAKSTINNQPPNKYKNILKKPRKQFDTERRIQIQHQNRVLLRKMLTIDSKHSPLHPDHLLPRTYSTRSLNKNQKGQYVENITLENRKILKRLQKAVSAYSIQKWENDRRFNIKVRDNISRNSGRVLPNKPMTDTESIYGGFYTKRARPVTSEQKVTDLKIDSERPYTHYFKSRGDKA